MSRIGKQFIAIPEKVNIKLEGQKVSIDGPKGSLSRILPSSICCTIDQENQKLFLHQTQNSKLSQSLYGLSRTLIANMITGVFVGFEKKLQITGVGYRAQLNGKELVLNIGYSHLVKLVPPTELSVKVENPTSVVISGMQKDMVSEFAAKVRAVRPPEPYKGKGIAYENEVIRRKVGKTSK